MVTDTARTANISGDDDIIASIDYMAEHCEKVGRKEPPKVICSGTFFITPGFRFRAVDVLMTNFHLPRSTLFMLVSAFAGLDTMRAAYEHAIASGYRFYSYGDASLLFRARTDEEEED